jgi:long-subunit fatty acid transport protein
MRVARSMLIPGLWTGRSIPGLLRNTVGLVALLAMLAPTTSAYAGGFAVPEIGTRKTAMGAMIGRPDDLSAIYHNPAGLVLSPGTNLYFNAGLSLPRTNMRARPWDGSQGYLTEPLLPDGLFAESKPTRAFGVIPMLVASTSILDDQAVVAIAFYVPNAVGAAFSETDVLRYHLIDSYLVTGFVTGSIAARLTPWLSVGAGLSLIYVRIKAERFLFPVLDGRDLSGLFGKTTRLKLSGEELTAGFNAGILLQPTSWLSIGAAMISRSDFDLDGDIEVIFGEDAPAKGTLTGRQKTHLVVPWTFQFGINADIGRWVEVGAELRYYTYSQFKEQRTTIEDIPLLTELVTPKNYRDSLQVSGGVKVRLPQLPALELMLGMHFDRTPAPNRTVSAEAPSFNHIGIHGGARYRLSRRWRFALTYAHYFYLQRDITDSVTLPPSNVRASGQNSILSVIIEAGFGGPANARRPGSS